MTDELFSKFDHIGVIVRNLDKAIEYYQSFGIGPFEPVRPFEAVERKSFGRLIDPKTARVKVKFADLGPVQLELVQPLDVESLAKDFLETKGEGVNHLGFLVDDIDKEEAELIEKGFKLLHRSRFENGGGMAYFDTGKIGGFLIELIQWPPEYPV